MISKIPGWFQNYTFAKETVSKVPEDKIIEYRALFGHIPQEKQSWEF